MKAKGKKPSLFSPERVLNQLKKARTFSQEFLLSLLHLLLKHFTHLKLETDSADWYLIAVPKNPGQPVASTKESAVITSSKRLMIKDGMLVINDSFGIRQVKPETIVYCETDRPYVCINTGVNNNMRADVTLKELLAVLPTDMFRKPRRESIVNRKFIKKIPPGQRGELELEGGKKLEMSRELKPDFKEWFNSFSESNK